MRIREATDVTFMIADRADQVREAKLLELAVFLDSGYVSQRQGDEIEEYRPYNSHSDFFIAMVEGKVVGLFRRIRVSQFGLPTLNDFEIADCWRELMTRHVALNSVSEIATIAVERRYRARAGFAVFSGLLRAVFQDSLRQGTCWWTFSIDYRAVRFVRTIYRFDMKPMGAIRNYMGSPTIPMALNIQKEALTLRQKAPDVADYLLRGMDDARLEAVLKAARRCNEGNGMSV